MSYEQNFLFSLALTIAIEIPIVISVIKYLFKRKEIKISEIIFVGVLASVITLPYFWFILPAFVSNRRECIVIGETMVIIVETIIYNRLLKLKFSESFIISLTANISSMLFGLFC